MTDLRSVLETASALASARLQKSVDGHCGPCAGDWVRRVGDLGVWSLPGLNRIHPVLGGMGAHTALGFVLVSTSLLLMVAVSFALLAARPS